MNVLVLTSLKVFLSSANLLRVYFVEHLDRNSL